MVVAFMANCMVASVIERKKRGIFDEAQAQQFEDSNALSQGYNYQQPQIQVQEQQLQEQHEQHQQIQTVNVPVPQAYPVEKERIVYKDRPVVCVFSRFIRSTIDY